MFNTLRHSSISDGPYFVETTAPPFDKKRHGKLARVACVNCRISKLKCSGEQGGCERCLAKKVECRYPTNPSSGPRRASRQPRSPPPASARAPSDSAESSAGDGSGPYASNQLAAYSFPDMGATHFDFTRSPSSNILAHGDERGFPADMIFSQFSDHAVPVDPLARPPPPSVDPADHEFYASVGSAATLATPTSDLHVDITSSSAAGDTVGSLPHSMDGSASGFPLSDQRCSCFADALGIFESIEVNLVWKLHCQDSARENLLREQKCALSECEALLQCRSCAAQSKFIMLVMAMCEKILSSMETLCPLEPPSAYRRRDGGGGGGGGWREIAPIKGMVVTKVYQDSLQGEPRDSVSVHSQYDSPKRGLNGSRSPFSDASSRGASDGNRQYYSGEEQSRKVRIGQWQLDDDDELLVLQSLVTTRLSRLSNLASMLGRLVDEHHWTAHKGKIYDMRQRCLSLSERLARTLS